MPLRIPRRSADNTEPPDMVRVQHKPGDIRSYRRRDAEEILAQTSGAFIVGGPDDPATKAKRSAPNKARQPKAAGAAPSEPSDGQAETKSE